MLQGKETEVVLGPGLTVYCNRRGITCFVVQSENDSYVTHVYVAELDKNWRHKLLGALFVEYSLV